MRKIIFFNTNQIEDIRLKIQSSISTWQAQWCFDNDELKVAFLGKNKALESAKIYALPASKGSFFQLDTMDFKLKDVVFGRVLPSVPNDDVNEFVLTQAYTELLGSIGDKFTRISIPGDSLVSIDVTEDQLAKRESFPGDHSLAYEIELGLNKLVLNLSSELLSNLVKVAKNSSILDKVSLDSVKGTVSAELELELGEFQVRDISNLAVGDILTSSTSLYSDFDLKIRGKQIASVRLGKSGAKKAILLNGNAKS